MTNRMDTIYKNKLHALCISARHFTFKICNSQLKIVIVGHFYKISYLSDYHATLFVGLYQSIKVVIFGSLRYRVSFSFFFFFLLQLLRDLRVAR